MIVMGAMLMSTLAQPQCVRRERCNVRATRHADLMWTHNPCVNAMLQTHWTADTRGQHRMAYELSHRMADERHMQNRGESIANGM